MGALPKKKLSKTRTRKRRRSQKVQLPTLVKCSNCHKDILSHTVCQYCGYYRGKEVIKKEAETKVTKA